MERGLPALRGVGKDLCVIIGCSSKQQAQIAASLGEKSEKVAWVRDWDRHTGSKHRRG